jgi:aldehyde dehydrogenase (NAD+)
LPTEVEPLKDLTKFYIDGAWVDPETPRMLPVENPATEAVIARLALGSGADVDRAVDAARAAFEAWAALPLADRWGIWSGCLRPSPDTR